MTDEMLKSEIRRPKSERSSKSEALYEVSAADWIFGFLSDFGLRISDFIPGEL